MKEAISVFEAWGERQDGKSLAEKAFAVAPAGPMNALELNEQLEHVQATFRSAAQLDQCIARLVEHVAPQQIEEVARLRGFPKIASAARRWARSHTWPA